VAIVKDREENTQNPVRSKGWLGLFLCGLAGVSYGCQGPLVKTAYAENMDVTTLLTIRLCVATLGIWLITAIVRPPLRYSPRKMAGFAILGANFVINTAAFYLALSQLAPGTTTLIVYTFPAMVLILAVFFLHEPITTTKGIVLVMAILGCALTIDFSDTGNFSWLGVLFSLVCAFATAVYAILSSKFGEGVPGLTLAAWSSLVTALLYVGWCVVTGFFQFGLSPVAYLCGIGVGCLTAVGIGAYLLGLQLIGASRASIAITTEPVAAVLLSALLLGESLTILKVVGGLLIVGAIVVLSLRRSDYGKRGSEA
jgi:drug/metabolite transporter (DMT)-like permease